MHRTLRRSLAKLAKTMEYLSERQASHPRVVELIELICKHNPLQKKALRAFLSGQDETYWSYAESVCTRLRATLLADDAAFDRSAEAYNRLCKNLLFEEFRFRQTGRYPTENASAALEQVYSQQDLMRYYALGLLFSHLFWPNHYRMVLFLEGHLRTLRADSVLEVGAGHGLLVGETLRVCPDARVTIVDISKASIDLARELLSGFGVDLTRVNFVHSDYLDFDAGGARYDFVIMGEVLEHVDDPQAFLRKARTMLADRASLYLTTCANCPAVDHVYHFHNVEEIRTMIHGAELALQRELVLPARPVPEAEWEKQRVTLNYAAILARS